MSKRKIAHLVSSNLKKRATSYNLSGTSAGNMGNTSAVTQSPLFYDYRWSTPDKYYFPRNRVTANSIWRMIYERDGPASIATDMYSEIPWSEFDLIGIEDKKVREIYEEMFSELDLVSKFEIFTRGYLVLGELILHTIFNSSKGIWERVISHNPDFVKVDAMGLAADQPLLSLIPTPEHRRLVHSADPRVRKLQSLLPKEVLQAIRANMPINLDPLNTTYMARRSMPDSSRGTSLYTRIFSIVMYEDFVRNGSMAVAQRNAVPLRIFKLGTTLHPPTEEQEQGFIDMLSQAEADPLSAIVTHADVNVDLVGTSDRALLISREFDYIERAKLLSLGLAKSFIVGESSYASAVAGMQVLMGRAAALRRKFEKEWMIKKLCIPIAKIHKFYKRPQSELDHRIRINDKTDRDLIIPKFKWHKTLDPVEDVTLLNTVWKYLHDERIISDRTYASGAGIDIDAERKNILEEKKYKDSNPDLYGIPGTAPGAAPPPSDKKLRGPLSGPWESSENIYSSEFKNDLRGTANNPYIMDLKKQLESAVKSDICEDLKYQFESTANSDGTVTLEDLQDVLAGTENPEEIRELSKHLPEGPLSLV